MAKRILKQQFQNVIVHFYSIKNHLPTTQNLKLFTIIPVMSINMVTSTINIESNMDGFIENL